MKGASIGFLLSLLFAWPVLADHTVNINTADKDTLMTLQGIGEVKAQAIIDYRDQNGPFAAKEDIQNVSGIGDVTYANIKDHITVSGGASPSPSPSPSHASTPSPNPSPSPAASSKVAPPKLKLYIDAGSDRVVVAGADTEFKVRAYDDKEIVETVGFLWNFGDGTTLRGARVHHRFAYPGRYAVIITLRGEEETATDRIVVTAEGATLSFSLLEGGGVAITNNGKNDLDLSRWIVHSPAAEFFLPDDSVVLAGQAIQISKETLGFASGTDTELRYPNGTLAYRPSEIQPEDISEVVPPSPSSDASEESKNEVEDENAIAEERIEEPKESNATSPQVAAAATGSSWKWWMGALALAFAGAGSVYAAKRYAKREWNIVDDTTE